LWRTGTSGGSVMDNTALKLGLTVVYLSSIQALPVRRLNADFVA
jgi:hypothetical protein